MNRAFLIDLAERVVFSFIGGALATLGVVGADITDLTLWQAAAIAGGSAVVSLVKGLIAHRIGDDSPGLKRLRREAPPGGDRVGLLCVTGGAPRGP